MRYLFVFLNKLSLKTYILLLSGAFLASITACNNENTVISTDEDPLEVVDPKPKDTIAYIRTKGEPIFVVVRTQTVIIRNKPNVNGTEIARMTKGDSLIYDNKLSDYTTPMKLEGVDYDEHWMHVRFGDNAEGWVYGGNVYFEGLSHDALAEIVYDKRLRKFFGNATADKVMVYKNAYKDMQTVIAFRTAWRQGEELRVTLESQMEQMINFMPSDVLPDFFWLNDVFPGFIVAYPKEEARYCLFKNYGFLYQQALATTGQEDDDLIDVYLKIYAQDSIEYLYQDWMYDLGEDGFCSRLGGGVHFDVLANIDSAWQRSDYFHEELNTIKQNVIDDVIGADKFWFAKDRIIGELDSILNKRFVFLDDANYIELGTRKEIIEKHKDYNVIVNWYAGGE